MQLHNPNLYVACHSVHGNHCWWKGSFGLAARKPSHFDGLLVWGLSSLHALWCPPTPIQIQEAFDSGAPLVDGYAPFCKHGQ